MCDDDQRSRCDTGATALARMLPKSSLREIHLFSSEVSLLIRAARLVANARWLVTPFESHAIVAGLAHKTSPTHKTIAPTSSLRPIHSDPYT